MLVTGRYVFVSLKTTSSGGLVTQFTLAPVRVKPLASSENTEMQPLDVRCSRATHLQDEEIETPQHLRWRSLRAWANRLLAILGLSVTLVEGGAMQSAELDHFVAAISGRGKRAFSSSQLKRHNHLERPVKIKTTKAPLCKFSFWQLGRIITHSFPQANLFLSRCHPTTLMISTAYVQISWSPCQNELWILFFSSKNEGRGWPHLPGSQYEVSMTADGLWHVLMWRRKSCTKGRMVEQLREV